MNWARVRFIIKYAYQGRFFPDRRKIEQIEVPPVRMRGEDLARAYQPNTCVECASCSDYQITAMAMKYYFEGDLLTPAPKQKLIEYLKTPGRLRIINSKAIWEVTGIDTIMIH